MTLEASLGLIKDLGLSKDNLDLLLRGTAERLFFSRALETIGSSSKKRNHDDIVASSPDEKAQVLNR